MTYGPITLLDSNNVAIEPNEPHRGMCECRSTVRVSAGCQSLSLELTHPWPTVLCHGEGCARSGAAEESRLG
jgi:hypothetical protein